MMLVTISTLNNAHGPDNNGALNNFRNIPTIAGRLDVGDEGSTISGDFYKEGTLAGRNLTLRHSGFQILTPQ